MIRRERRQSLKNAYVKLNEAYKNYDYKNQQYSINNISRGGLCFTTQDVFIVDDIINASIYIDDEIVHSAKCRICYFEENKTPENSSNYGLSFVDKFIDMKFCTS